jgi:hypothetical protein
MWTSVMGSWYEQFMPQLIRWCLWTIVGVEPQARGVGGNHVEESRGQP